MRCVHPNPTPSEIQTTSASRQQSKSWKSSWPNVKLYLMIHPEVQIMSYLSKEDLPEQANGYVGSSKNACFICSSFCRCLGMETRGCDYDQYTVWTTPTVGSLSSAQFATLVNALLETEKSFKEQLCPPISLSRTLANPLDTTERAGIVAHRVATNDSAATNEEQRDAPCEGFLDAAVQS